MGSVVLCGGGKAGEGQKGEVGEGEKGEVGEGEKGEVGERRSSINIMFADSSNPCRAIPYSAKISRVYIFFYRGQQDGYVSVLQKSGWTVSRV